MGRAYHYPPREALFTAQGHARNRGATGKGADVRLLPTLCQFRSASGFRNHLRQASAAPRLYFRYGFFRQKPTEASAVLLLNPLFTLVRSLTWRISAYPHGSIGAVLMV